MTNKLLTAGIGLAIIAGGVGVTDAQINPYTDTGRDLVFEAESSIKDAGMVGVELVKSRPEVKLQKWNKEVELGIRYEGVQAEGSRALMTNRMEWKGIGEEVHAYPLESVEGMEDGGFEIEVVLNEKPDTNIFEFKIDGAEDLDFFYQPELTQEEIDGGASRPENVVGSYAVYHKEKRNHQIGDTNYATGKAFHIYRPKAIDADGNETWGELQMNTETGVLSVFVDEKWLVSAEYPVRVDPTFGYTTLGSSGSNIANGNFDQSLTTGRNYVLSQDASLDSLSAGVFLSSGTTANMDLFIGVYDEDSGGTGVHDLITNTETLNQAIDTTKTFYTITASGEFLPADTYILAALGNGGNDLVSGEVAQVASDSVSSGNIYQESAQFSSDSYDTRKAEDPWTETALVNNTQHSIYATYTASSTSRRIIITQ